MSSFRSVRFVSWAIPTFGMLLCVQCRAQDVNAGGKVNLTAQKMTQTPQVRALCLPGTGGTKAYATAITDLIKFANSNNLKTTGFVFSDTWKQGPDPNDPGTGSNWDVCVVSAAPDTAASPPFIFRELKPRDAAYGICDSTPDDLSTCFALLEAFSVANKYYPAAPPRYVIRSEGVGGKKTYDIWLPVSPIQAPPSTNAGSEQPQ